MAATAPLDGFLRQGCLLVPAEAASWTKVGRDGSRETIELTHDAAKAYAATTALAFGVGTSRVGDQAVKFYKDLASADVTTSKAVDEGKSGKGKGGKGKAGKAKGAEAEPTGEPVVEE